MRLRSSLSVIAIVLTSPLALSAGSALKNSPAPEVLRQEVAEAKRRVRIYLQSPSVPFPLPEGMAWVAAYDRLLILESPLPLASEDLEKLRAMNGVLAVERDAVVLRPHADHSGGKATSERPVEKCELTERCPNGKPKFWGQQVMMVEQMHQLMDRMGVKPETRAEVAVVDSGFDTTQADGFDSFGGVRTARGVLVGEEHPFKKYSKVTHYKKGEEVIGDPATDNNGHGTMVSSTIVGKQGMGVAREVHLSVYRVTKAGSSGSTSSAWLEMSLLRACEENRDPDGLTIINSSWGGRLDESGLSPSEEDEVTRQVIARLAERGCLVMKSAGNDNFRASRKDDLDDAYLRVAATDPSLGLASFSTVGEVGAPGENIYVRDTSLQRITPDKDKLCGAETGKRFVNGTSFAAPFTAGIASQVVRALKSEGALAGLTPAERIRLVNRILRASMDLGTINGLRAVAIAGIWARRLTPSQRREAIDGEPADGVVFLEGLLERFPMKVCERERLECEKRRDCADRKNCVALGRTQAALCRPPALALSEDLARTAFDMGAFELGHFYSRQAQAHSGDPKVIQNLRRMAVQGYLRKEGYYDVPPPPKKDRFGLTPYVPYDKRPEVIRKRIFREVPANFMTSTLAPYLEEFTSTTRSASGDFVLQAAEGILGSYDIQSSLEQGFDPSTGEDRGSNMVLDGVHSILRSARRSTTEAKFQDLIRKFVEQHVSQVDFNVKHGHTSFEWNHATAVARVLDRLIGDETPGSRMHNFYLEEEARLVESMRKMNEFYGKETQALVLFLETYPDRPSLDPLLGRHLEKSIRTVREHGLGGIAPVETHYLLGDPKRSKALEPRVEFLFRVLEQIAKGRGWGDKNDKEMVETVMGELLSHLLTASPEDKAKVEDRFREVIEGAESVDFVGQLLNGYWSDGVFGLDRLSVLLEIRSDEEKRKAGLTYKGHPLMTEETIALLSHKAAAALMHADPEQAAGLKIRFDTKYGLGLTWKGLASDTKVEPDTEIVVPGISEKFPSRLDEEPKSGPKTVKVSEAGFPEFLLGAVRLAKDAKSAEVGGEILEKLDVGYSVQYQPELRAMLDRLPATGPWRKEVDEFVAKEGSWKTHMARFHMKRFFELLDRVNHDEIQAEKQRMAQEQLKEFGRRLQPLGASLWRWFEGLPWGSGANAGDGKVPDGEEHKPGARE